MHHQKSLHHRIDPCSNQSSPTTYRASTQHSISTHNETNPQTDRLSLDHKAAQEKQSIHPLARNPRPLLFVINSTTIQTNAAAAAKKPARLATEQREISRATKLRRFRASTERKSRLSHPGPSQQNDYYAARAAENKPAVTMGHIIALMPSRDE